MKTPPAIYMFICDCTPKFTLGATVFRRFFVVSPHLITIYSVGVKEIV